MLICCHFCRDFYHTSSFLLQLVAKVEVANYDYFRDRNLTHIAYTVNSSVIKEEALTLVDFHTLSMSSV